MLQEESVHERFWARDAGSLRILPSIKMKDLSPCSSTMITWLMLLTHGGGTSYHYGNG